jgi:hypothetical protein
VRALPGWVLVILIYVSALLVWVGIKEQDQVGYVPLVLGCTWAFVTLISLAQKLRGDEE